MKKLLTLILPALALTAGAPLAEAEGYLWGAFARGQKGPAAKTSPRFQPYAFGFSVGETSQEAAQQSAISKCTQAGGQDCHVTVFISNAPLSVQYPDGYNSNPDFFDNEYPNGKSCLAYINWWDEDRPHSGVPKVGGSKEEVINKAMQGCKEQVAYLIEHGFQTPIVPSSCHQLALGCVDDGVPQVADAAADPAPAPGDGVARYGAFAFDGANGATGFSVWYPSQSSAEQRALTECAQHGGENCEIKHRFPHRCAAVATAGDQGEWAWGFAADNSKPPAVERALAECRSRGLGACRLEASVCGQETN